MFAPVVIIYRCGEPLIVIESFFNLLLSSFSATVVVSFGGCCCDSKLLVNVGRYR